HRRFSRHLDPTNWKVDQLWTPGDSLNLAIGQGFLSVTPLQMARFYAMIANGGKLVTPHVLMDVEQASSRSDGRTLPARTFPPPVSTNLSAGALDVVRKGLLEATHASFGTSSAIFGSFPVPIAGKTGTAEKALDPGDGYSRIFDQA